MQVLQPLAIGDVRSSAGHVFDVLGVDQEYLQAAILQNLHERNPIYAGGFHGDSSDSALLQPIRKPVQIDGKRRKHPHGIRVPISGYGHINLSGADIDPRRIGIHDW
jgi:hypothetical protein